MLCLSHDHPSRIICREGVLLEKFCARSFAPGIADIAESIY